jgi:predicted nucleic acid-binding protein
VVVTGDLDLIEIDPDKLNIEVLTPRQLTDRLS